MNMNTGNGKSDHIGLNSNQNHVYDENHLEPHSMTIIMDHNSMEGQLISDSNGTKHSIHSFLLYKCIDCNMFCCKIFRSKKEASN